MTGAEVLYVHALPYGPDADPHAARYPVIPVGVPGLLNGLVAEGFAVAGLNEAAEQVAADGVGLAAWLERHAQARLVLLDLHWYEHARGVACAARAVKQALPGARVVVGGLTATRFADEVLARLPDVDAVVLGQGEAALPLLAREVVREGRWPPEAAPGVAHRGGRTPPARGAPPWIEGDPVDLSFLRSANAYRRLLYSWPRRGLPARGGGRAQWLPNGRGCAFACTYCGGTRDAHRALLGLERVARRDAEAFARDARRLADLGVDQVAPSLDPDMLGRAHVDATFDALARELGGRRLGLYVESYQLPSERLLAGLDRVADPEHTELALTPLSGDEAVRRRNGKSASNARLLEALARLAQAGWSASLFFSLNLPGEDERTIQATVDLARRALDVLGPGRLRLIDIGHTLDPGSPIAERPQEHGVREVTLRTFADYLEHGRRMAHGGPWALDERSRGFVVGGRDLAAMAARWDALAAEVPEAVVAVPRR